MQKPNTLMCVLSYLGILSLIPFFAEKNDPFIQYHAKQGLILCIIEIVLNVVLMILLFIPVVNLIAYILSSVVGVVFVVLAILGIVAACKGEEKELPIVGAIKIIK